MQFILIEEELNCKQLWTVESTGISGDIVSGPGIETTGPGNKGI